MTIVDMVARNARKYPDALAFVELSPSRGLRREITWKEFNYRVNKLANALIARGVRKGDRVLHMMMNSIDWLEAYFAIIKTGAWAVPLNFRFISAQIQYCADVAEPKIIIFDENFSDRVVPIRNDLKTVEKFIFVGKDTPEGTEAYEDIIARAADAPLDSGLTGDDECALYFTSGTTGEPKATLLTHRNMVATAMHETYAHRQTNRDNFLLLQPLYHTGGKMHWFGSLIVGARCTMISGVERITPQFIMETISQEKITECMLLVPWIQDLVTALDCGDIKLEDYDISSWRLMHSGAQPIPPTLIRHWKGWLLDVQYETHFGLTESTGPCIHLGMENIHRVGAIGKPVLEQDARIVDDNDNDVPVGVVGELLLKGDNIMKEYYRNPGKTAEALKGGWLHTGDMCKIDEDGFITFIDRKKDLIISGGENIFPVEIEDLLHGQPKVNDVAIIGVPDERLGEVAIAIIDPKPGCDLSIQEIRGYFEPLLPKYNWPRLVIFDKVPRNPTGKIEKPKLRDKYRGLDWRKETGAK